MFSLFCVHVRSLPLLLPAVEDGIFSDSWRIRQSSVELLGDLLFKVAGTSGKALLEGGSDDEGASTEAQGRAIIEVLRREKRNDVLAALYMLRTDVSLTVRQAALHVWKTIVANTPKTLKEIMPVLMNTLITSLASSSSERRQVAGRSLGELVRKLGERVLPLIIPILSRGLKDPNASRRQVRLYMMGANKSPCSSVSSSSEKLAAPEPAQCTLWKLAKVLRNLRQVSCEGSDSERLEVAEAAESGQSETEVDEAVRRIVDMGRHYHDAIELIGRLQTKVEGQRSRAQTEGARAEAEMERARSAEELRSVTEKRANASDDALKLAQEAISKLEAGLEEMKAAKKTTDLKAASAFNVDN
ncbi:uncharacterized protein LOC114290547 [Camellia sinensis]|uniref:uncharacterized protein LOC114290547 n=1 Tax=Camellia sinensis TaxID=4442 RepID=UPI001036848B|nr:uncharacterized protein LOC114290547 [Camellia sinensis]